MPEEFEQRLRALDWKLFRYVPNQTSVEDRTSLLALQNACRDAVGRYRYLEIGSFRGGSLQPFLADELCTAVTSIDSRPARAPDARGASNYPDNTTDGMLANLRAVPGADLDKLITLEATTDELDPEQIERPDLCFVDAEHTDDAALRDARFCRAAMRGEGAIAFHDRQLIGAGLERFVSECDGEVAGFELPQRIFVVELGPPRIAGSAWIRDRRDPG
jgi:hypothetical protein